MRIILLLLFPFTGFSQVINIPFKDGKIFYELIDSVPGQKKDATYSALRSWMANTFVSAKDVIQMDDKESGQLVGKGIMTIHSKGLAAGAWPCYFTIAITAKDEKYRIQLYNFSYGEAKHSMESVYEMYQKGKQKNATENMVKEMNEKAVALMADAKSRATFKLDDF